MVDSTTSKIAIPANEWTLVASGQNIVTIGGNPNGYRVAVGAAEPGDLTTGPIVGRTADGLYEVSGLSAEDGVYVTPIDGVAFTAQVIITPDTGGGGGGHAYEAFGALPLSSSFVHGGASTGSTTTDSKCAILVKSSNNGQNTVEDWLTASPAAPYDVFARVSLDVERPSANNTQFGIVVQDSVTGKLLILTLNYEGGIGDQQWASPSSFHGAGAIIRQTFPQGYDHIWLRIEDDGTDLNTYYGYDGITWVLLNSVSHASYMTNVSDHYGFCLVPGDQGCNALVTSLSVSAPA